MSSIMQYNGAAVICMAGKKCVGIASDKRYGLQNQTVGCDMRKTFKLNDKTLVGLTGLASDMQTLEQKFVFRSNVSRSTRLPPPPPQQLATESCCAAGCAAADNAQPAALRRPPTSVGILFARTLLRALCPLPIARCSPALSPTRLPSVSRPDSSVRTLLPPRLWRARAQMYKLREERDMSPVVFSNMVSSLLYEKRFGPYFCEPVICGLEGEENKPYLCGMDLLGAQVYTDDFILAGDCPEAMYGLCESLYKPDLEADDLFEVLAQCLLSGVDRDCLAGWGATVHIMTPEGLITRELKGRMD
jgi:20S proteasome alpha/beta subunit